MIRVGIRGTFRYIQNNNIKNEQENESVSLIVSKVIKKITLS